MLPVILNFSKLYEENKGKSGEVVFLLNSFLVILNPKQNRIQKGRKCPKERWLPNPALKNQQKLPSQEVRE